MPDRVEEIIKKTLHGKETPEVVQLTYKDFAWLVTEIQYRDQYLEGLYACVTQGENIKEQIEDELHRIRLENL